MDPYRCSHRRDSGENISLVTSNTNCRCIKFRGSKQNGANFNGLICPLFDGRRGQIYTGLYTYEGEQLTSIEEDRIILVDWLQMLKDKRTACFIYR